MLLPVFDDDQKQAILDTVKNYIEDPRKPRQGLTCMCFQIWTADALWIHQRQIIPENSLAVRTKREEDFGNEELLRKFKDIWNKGYLPIEIVFADICVFYALPLIDVNNRSWDVSRLLYADGDDIDLPRFTYRPMEVSFPWAGHIFSGTKKVEVRKNGPTWGNVIAGDRLLISDVTDPITKYLFKVVAVRKYKGIEECLEKEGVEKLLPGKKTMEEGLQVYLGFDGADPETIAKRKQEFDEQGAIAIELART